MSRVKALFTRAVKAVPAWFKKDGLHVGLVFVAAFVGTAKPLLPSLTSTPDFRVAKAAMAAAVVAGIKAGIRAAEPVAVALAVKVAYKIVAKVEAKKAVSAVVVQPATAAAVAGPPETVTGP